MFFERKTLNQTDLEDIYFESKQDSLYEIDGLVISKDRDYIRSSDSNPKYSVAFKVNSQGKNTTIQEVLWEVSTRKSRLHEDYQ